MSVRVEVLLTLVALIAIGFLLGKLVERLLAGQSRGGRLAMAAPLTLLCVPGLWFSVYYLHLLPETVWLYRLRSLPGANLWLTLLLPTAVAWGSVLPGWMKLPGCAGALVAMTLPFFKPVFNPLKEGDLGNHWEGNACLQSTASTCGAASAASILRSLGDTAATEKELAEAAWSSATGTEAWHLSRALQKRGRQTHFSFEGLPEASGLPGILGVKIGSYGHFIAILQEVGGRLVVVDPLVGERSMTRLEFEERYQSTGFFMAVR